MLVKLSQSENASPLIFVTPSGIVYAPDFPHG